MTEVATYSQGAPCFAELFTQDRLASMDFYGAVFGWDYQVGPEDQGFFTLATLSGRSVAGLVPPLVVLDAPTAWVTYLSVTDLDATLAAIGPNGGASLSGVISAPGTDLRVALATDPTGAAFGLYESVENPGADLVGVPGAQSWSELRTPDPVAARRFYTDLLGVEISASQSGDNDLMMFRTGGRDVGSIGVAPTGAPRWITYFGASDTEVSVDLVRTAGGKVHEVRPSERGEIAVCEDPQGAEFFLSSTTRQN